MDRPKAATQRQEITSIIHCHPPSSLEPSDCYMGPHMPYHTMYLGWKKRSRYWAWGPLDANFRELKLRQFPLFWSFLGAKTITNVQWTNSHQFPMKLAIYMSDHVCIYIEQKRSWFFPLHPFWWLLRGIFASAKVAIGFIEFIPPSSSGFRSLAHKVWALAAKWQFAFHCCRGRTEWATGTLATVMYRLFAAC